MQVQVNTDNHISGDSELTAQVQAAVDSSVGHLRERITRVEVHLSDENSDKGGADDKRCAMEARMEGYQPVAVTHQAPSVELAVDGAAEKLKTALDHILGRLQDR